MSNAPSSDITNAPPMADDSEVFKVVTLSSETFVVPSTLAQRISQSCQTNSVFTGKVTCSAPFTSADGRSFLAVGCAEGVWIGFLHETRSLRHVLQLKTVTQCAPLEAFGIFLVLADEVLLAYDIEAIVASYLQSTDTPHATPLKLSGSGDVQFFSLGCLEGRTLVAYMTKKRITDSAFRVLEPIAGRETASVSPIPRLGLRQSPSDWFRVYRDFCIPTKAHDLIFLRTKVAILCEKGFEIMDISDFRSFTAPQSADPRYKKLSKRCEACRPMGIFLSGKDEYLLCYDKFGLYMNNYGDPSPTKNTIDWEGTAEHVAWHPPYILIFNLRSIEVRHVSTGRLCQIIRGQDLQCTWDGYRSSISSFSPDLDGTWDETPVPGEHVHGAMRADDSPQERASLFGTASGVEQYIFALTPTTRQFPSPDPEEPSPPTQH